MIKFYFSAALGILLALRFCILASESCWENDYEIGYQAAYGVEENGITRNRPYFLFTTSYSPESEGSTLTSYDASFRGWDDFAESEKNLEIRALYIDKTSDRWSLKTGFQEISWGETFGLYILDLVNPRDLTDPFFNDLSWIRLPVFTVNAQYFQDPWNCQLIFTPIPRNNWLPKQGSPWDVFPDIFDNSSVLGPHKFAVSRCGQDAEYGGKLEYLFESGIDLTAYYFRHWNRYPVYKAGIDVGIDGAHSFLKPVLRRIQTIGASFSKAYEEIVLRGDSTLSFRTPWQEPVFGLFKKTNLWRTILGLDYTNDNGMTVGFQYHFDLWNQGHLHSISIRYLQDYVEGKYQFAFFIYKGINNGDIWVQPAFIWNINDSASATLQADILGGHEGNGTPKDGFIGPYRHKSRFFLWVKYQW